MWPAPFQNKPRAYLTGNINFEDRDLQDIDSVTFSNNVLLDASSGTVINPASLAGNSLTLNGANSGTASLILRRHEVDSTYDLVYGFLKLADGVDIGSSTSSINVNLVAEGVPGWSDFEPGVTQSFNNYLYRAAAATRIPVRILVTATGVTIQTVSGDFAVANDYTSERIPIMYLRQ